MATTETTPAANATTAPDTSKAPVSGGKSGKDRLSPHKMRIVKILHTLVLIASIGLIVLISWDSFHNISFLASQQYIFSSGYACSSYLI